MTKKPKLEPTAKLPNGAIVAGRCSECGSYVALPTDFTYTLEQADDRGRKSMGRALGDAAQGRIKGMKHLPLSS